MEKFLRYFAAVLLIVGGLNWGFVGVADFNLVTAIFGVGTILTKVTYILIGVAAIFSLINFIQHKSHHTHA